MKKVFSKFSLLILLAACNAPEGGNKTSDSTSDSSKAKVDTSGSNAKQSPFLYGIDISSYQGDEIDFLNRKQDTLSFVICRATLGITFNDPDFSNNWTLIPQKGFVRGAYHFYMCDDDPTKQAQHYLQIVGSIGAGDLPPILDFEQAGLAGVTNKQKIQSDLLTFLTTVESATKRTPLIYVSPDFADEYLSNPAFAKYPLYVADYDGQNQPSMPTLWKSTTWKCWQKTDSVRVDGNQNDFDVFNGDAAALKQFLNSGNQ